MHIIPLITNPIFINTVIVFVRIHWFEKRLESLGMKLTVSEAEGRYLIWDNIVQDAKLGRWRTTTKSRPDPGDVDPEREERGVGKSELNP